MIILLVGELEAVRWLEASLMSWTILLLVSSLVLSAVIAELSSWRGNFGHLPSPLMPPYASRWQGNPPS